MPRSGRCGSKGAKLGGGGQRCSLGLRASSCSSGTAEQPQPVGAEDAELQLVARRRAGRAPGGRGRPTSARSNRGARPCPSRCGAGGTPGRARGSAGTDRLAVGSRAGRRRRSPAAAGRGRRSRPGRRADLGGGVADLDHPDVDLVRRAAGEDRGHACRRRRPACGRPRPAPAPSRCARGRIACGIVGDVEGEGRRRPDRRSSRGRARRRGVGERSRPRAPPRTPRPAAGSSARGSSPCR